ncbi:MAG: DNA repair protein RecO [Candidatus Kapaibacterium sp.]
MNVSTNAIILRTMNYLESSKIIYSYTREFGKQTLVAKGARRTKSKFGASLELGSIVELKYYKKSNKDLHNLTYSELIHKTYIERLSFTDKVFCLMLCESIFHLEKDDNPDEFLFDELMKLFDISCSNYIFTPAMFIYSQIILANSIGHAIDLRWKNKDKVDYSDDNEVFLDISNCKIYNDNDSKAERKIKFKISELKILKEIISRNLNIKVESIILNKFVSFFENYFTFHNESRFTYKSFNLIRD